MNISSNKLIGKRDLNSLFIIIHDLLSQKDIFNYIKKLVSDTNINKLYSISKYIYDYKTPSSNDKKNDTFSRKYNILIYLLCTEAITIDEFETYLEPSININDIYILLAIELNRLNGIKIYRKKKVIDYLPKLEYGMINIMSYKDLDNIINEIEYILKLTYPDSIDSSDNNKISTTCTLTSIFNNPSIFNAAGKSFKDLAVYLIKNYFIVNGDFINIEYTDATGYYINSDIHDPIPRIFDIMPYVSLYLNNNMIPESVNITDYTDFDLDVENDKNLKDYLYKYLFVEAGNTGIDNILNRYAVTDKNLKKHLEAKEIAKLLPIILERTINYNEI